MDEKKVLRNSGFNFLKAVKWGAHICHFYKSKEDLLDLLIPYFRAGLENNEYCIWIVSEPLTCLEVKSVVQKKIPSMQTYFEKGQIEVLAYTDWYLKDGVFCLERVLNGWLEKYEFALSRGFEGLRVSGNTAWLEDKDWESFAKYEEAINKTIGGHHILAVCTYSLEKCGAADIVDVVRNHELAIIRREGRWVTLENSELRQAKSQLDEIAEFNRKILDSSPVGIITFDAGTGRCVTANEEAERILEKSNEDILKCNLLECAWWEESGLRKAALSSLRDNAPWHNEIKALTEAGSEKYLDCRIVPFSSNGGAHLLFVFSDITDLKKTLLEKSKALAEAEASRTAREFLDNMPDPVVMTDIAGNITYFNDTLRSYGYGEEVLGKPYTVFTGTESARYLEQMRMECVKGGTVSFECVGYKKDGEAIPVMVNAAVLKDNSGGIKGFVVAARDCTRIVHAEEAREQVVQELNKRIRELKLLYGVSSILQDCEKPVDEIMDKILALLPHGWRHPEITAARIRINGKEYSTPNFIETEWKQSVSFKTSHAMSWSIEIVYLEQRPLQFEGPFLEEERKLLDSIADMLKSCCERRHEKESLQWELAANSAIAELSRALITTNTLEEIAGIVLEVALRFTRSKFGYVGYIDPLTGCLVSPTLTTGIWETCQVERKKWVFDKPKGLFGWVLREKKPLLTNKPSEDSRSTGTPPGHIVLQKFLSVPALMGDELLGQIALANSVQDYTEKELVLTQRLATLYALAIKRHRETQALQQADLIVQNSTAMLLRCKAQKGLPIEFISGNINSYGYSPEELLKKKADYIDLVFHEDRAIVESRLLEHMSDKDEFEQEYRIKAGNGKVRWVEERSTVETEAAGDNVDVYYHGVVIDITERKEAELRILDEIQISNQLLLIAESMVKTSDADILMEQATLCVKKIVNCNICLSYLWDPESKYFRPCSEKGLSSELAPLFRMEVLNLETPSIKECLEKKSSLHLKFLLSEAEGFEWLGHIKDMILIPLIGKDDYLGLIAAVYTRHTREILSDFNRRDKKLCNGISSQVSIALEKALLNKITLYKTIELSRKIETIETMNLMDRSILSTFDTSEILEIAARMVSKVIPCDKAALYLIDKGANRFTYSAGFGFKSIRKGAGIEFKDTTATDVLKTGIPQYVSNLLDIKRVLPFEAQLVREGCASLIRVPLIVKGQIIGLFTLASRRPSAFSTDDIVTLEKLGFQIAIAFENSRLLNNLEELLKGIIKSLSHSIDAKSHWTRGHSERVTKIAIELGKELGLGDQELKDLSIAGLLHDIGKIGTYEAILEKTGKLTDEEKALIMKHPEKGVEILEPIKQLENVIPAIKHHHEFFDGTGYPSGIKGADIPLLARILAVSDSVDAMAADRPYRKGMPMASIIKELKRCSGTQFDPEVVQCFIKVFGKTGLLKLNSLKEFTDSHLVA